MNESEKEIRTAYFKAKVLKTSGVLELEKEIEWLNSYDHGL